MRILVVVLADLVLSEDSLQGWKLTGLATSFKAKLHCMHLIHKILDLAICQNYKYTAFTKILIASSCRSID